MVDKLKLRFIDSIKDLELYNYFHVYNAIVERFEYTPAEELKYLDEIIPTLIDNVWIVGVVHEPTT